MSFRVTQSPTFRAPVVVELPREEGGTPVKQTFDIEFPRMSGKEHKAFMDYVLKNEIFDDEVTKALIMGTWKTWVYGADSEEAKAAKPMRWWGVTDDKDQPLVVSEGNVDALLTGSVVGVGTAIAKVFYHEVRRATSKN